ncbi:MAG: ABC transporter permease [Gammaproteobacteria bacterium]|jgi:ABC-type lipoprotein release transport system permease subunit
MRAVGIISRLAWRNLWRNHRRTLIMIAAVSVGIWAMMFMTALMRGMVNDMVRDSVKSLPGHVQVHHPDYRDDPNVANFIAEPSGKLLAALNEKDVVGWASRVRVPAVVSSERESRSVTFVGVDPARERAISFVAADIDEGRFLEDRADSGIIIGRKLADTLDTGLGKRIVIMSQDPDNEIADRGFRIVGLFDSSLQALEESYVFTGIETAQQLLKIGDQVHEIAVTGTGFRNIDPLYQSVAAAAGPDLSTLPWYELDSYLGTMLGVMDGFVLVWIVVIFLALSFGLVNTLVMAVFERVREIGLMLALGMKPVMILGQVIVESVMLLLIGLLIGNLLAYATVVPLSGGIDLSVVAEGMEFFGASAILYPALEINDVIMSNVIVIVLGILASLSPAWRASRYQPIEAITKV